MANSNCWNEAKKYLKTNLLCDNSGNEAKKLLKTGYIASNDGAD